MSDSHSFNLRKHAVITPGGREMFEEIEGLVALDATTRVLSVACGLGEMELYMAAKYGCRVVGLDLMANFMRTATTRARNQGLASRAAFVRGDATRLPFEQACFDRVLCFGALFSFFDQGLPEIKRVLRPGGMLALQDGIWLHDEVSEPIKEGWHASYGRIYTQAEYRQVLLDHGLRVVFEQVYKQPEWWYDYYRARGDGQIWQEEDARYRASINDLGLMQMVLVRD